jgi:hypothetical protein
VVFVPDELDPETIASMIDEGLPDSFRGWPTRYGWDAVPVQHYIVVSHQASWLVERLGFDPECGIRELD